MDARSPTEWRSELIRQQTRRIFLALTLTGVVFAASAPAAMADGTMKADCDAGKAGVQASCDYASGATFRAQVYVTSPPAAGYRLGFQLKLAWADANIEYLPTALPADEARWPSCTIAVHADNQPGDPSLLYTCIPFAPAPGTFTGAVAQFKLKCQADGVSPLTLVPAAGDSQGGTVFIDASANTIDPALRNASVQCDSGGGSGDGGGDGGDGGGGDGGGGGAIDPERVCGGLEGNALTYCVRNARRLARCDRRKGKAKRRCVRKARKLAKCDRRKGKAKRRCVRKASRVGRKR